ncbi:hypothetical protein ACFWC6_32170 [Micromonospora chalcea]
MTDCYPATIHVLGDQGYRHVPAARACAHGLTGGCRACLVHHRSCEDRTGLDHAIIAARDGVRYLFTWVYQDADIAAEWAADYASHHGLSYRVNDPDDLEAYCPGVVSVRYHRKADQR